MKLPKPHILALFFSLVTTALLANFWPNAPEETSSQDKEKGQALLQLAQEDERHRGWFYPGAIYREAYTLNPNLHEALDGWMLSADRGNTSRRESIKLIKKELKDTPNCGKCHLALARIYRFEDSKRQEDVSEEYRLAYNAFPDDPEILGDYLDYMSNADTAVEVLSEFLERHPDNLEHRSNLADILAKRSDAEEAMAHQASQN